MAELYSESLNAWDNRHLAVKSVNTNNFEKLSSFKGHTVDDSDINIQLIWHMDLILWNVFDLNRSSPRVIHHVMTLFNW